MRIGVDASNIREGGGVVHLQKILEHVDLLKCGIDKVVVWGGGNTIDKLPSRSGIELKNMRVLNNDIARRLLWQQGELYNLANNNCDILFVPGGSYLGGFRPYVTMFQNMQVFDAKERRRENFKEWLRIRMLQTVQTLTFKRASGLICLSEYASNYLCQHYPLLFDKTKVQLIPHGTEHFKNYDSMTRSESSNDSQILKILYVSTVKQYKHQWNLIDAVGALMNEGIELELHLVGGGDVGALQKMKQAIKRNHTCSKKIIYHGSLPYEETLEWFKKVDMFVFPSTCENMPVVLLEAMTFGLPILSSDRGPMPEVLKDSGLYFNPESVTSIKNSLRYIIKNPKLRKHLGEKAKQYSLEYSWNKCADETFVFLHSVYGKYFE